MIVCVNTYDVDPDRAEAFEGAFRAVIDLLSTKPGFMRVGLHRAESGSGRFMTYAQWESREHQKQAGTDPALVPRMKAVLAIARPQAEWFDLVFETQGVS